MTSTIGGSVRWILVIFFGGGGVDQFATDLSEIVVCVVVLSMFCFVLSDSKASFWQRCLSLSKGFLNVWSSMFCLLQY